MRSYLSNVDKRTIPMDHLKVLSAVSRCRTAELGGHVDGCDKCGHLRMSYNSCRNRHCPKCQGLSKESWIVMQEDMLLPVSYYHVVITLPHELNLLCMYNPREMYDLLFKSSWHVLNTMGRDEKWVGGQLSATMLLHTWSQTLQLHPHIHCIVSNGGLDKEGNWRYPRRSKDNFLFPVQAMRDLHRGYFMEKLLEKISQGSLTVPKDYYKTHGGNYWRWRNKLYSKEWVVFTKKPFSGVKHVINYLGRYSHKVAITNGRILNIEEGKVTFKYKDYKDGAKKKEMRLEQSEFVRRFRLHILPSGFRKVRQYGLSSNAAKGKRIEQARKALGQKHSQLLKKRERKQLAMQRLQIDFDQCPVCKKGKMKRLMILSRTRPPPHYDSDDIFKTAFHKK